MEANNIKNLPIDILLDIFLQLDSIQHLSSLVTTNKHIHTAFQQRRSLILGRVFEKQISRHLLSLQRLYPASQQGSSGAIYNSQILQIVQSVDHTIGQCSNNDDDDDDDINTNINTNSTEDVLTLDAAAWRAFKAFDCRPGVLELVGEKSISRFIALDRRDLALQRAKEVCDLVVDDEQVRALSSEKEQRREREQKAEQLVSRYAAIFDEVGWQSEANELIRCCRNTSSGALSLHKFSGHLEIAAAPRLESMCSWNSLQHSQMVRNSQGMSEKSTVLRRDRRGEKNTESYLRDMAWQSLHRARHEGSNYTAQADSNCGRREPLVGTSLVMTV